MKVQSQELSKGMQGLKKKTVDELVELGRDVDELLGAVEIIIEGGLVPQRLEELRQIRKIVRGYRTRVQKAKTEERTLH